MGIRLIALFLLFGAVWDLFTTFRGVSQFFDLAMDAKINPTQFFFALVITIVVFGFVMATHYIWMYKVIPHSSSNVHGALAWQSIF